MSDYQQCQRGPGVAKFQGHLLLLGSSKLRLFYAREYLSLELQLIEMLFIFYCAL